MRFDDEDEECKREVSGIPQRVSTKMSRSTLSMLYSSSTYIKASGKGSFQGTEV